MKEDTYHLARFGQNTGPYTLAQVREMWRAGTLGPDTLFWRPGDPEWQPLGQIAFALGSAPAAAGQPMPYPNATWPGEMPRNSGLAIASFVLAFTSFLLFFPFLPAIICGHLALSQIKHSAGRLTGRGFAITGLVIGYLWVGLFGCGLGLGLLLPIFAATTGKGEATRELERAKQIGLAIRLYEGDNDGKTPPDLEALVPTYLTHHSDLVSRLHRGDQEPGFELLLPNAKVENLDPHTALLRGRYTTKDHKRAYIYVDASGEMQPDTAEVTPPTPTPSTTP